MNKKLTFLTLLLLLVSSWSFGQLGNANIYISQSPMSPCVGGQVTFTAVDTSGLIPPQTLQWAFWDFGDGSVASGQMVPHTYTQAGNYTVCAFIWDSLVGGDTTCIMITVEPNCLPSDLFEGDVYIDNNGNGSRDTGEPPFPYAPIRVAQTGAIYAADINGHYSITLPSGSWDLEAVPPTYYGVSQPAGGSYAVTSSGAGNTTTGNDFGLDPIANQQDLVVTMYAAPPVPGFFRTFYISAYNAGTQTQSGSVVFSHDAGVSYVSSNPTGSYANPNVTWNFTSLHPRQFLSYEARVYLDTAANVGDTLCHLVTINPVTGDLTPANNIDTLCQEIVASYDPNDKAVSPTGNGIAGEIPPGTELTYKVRFQNTGNFYATNVFIRDTLDADLDWSTFKVLGFSHPMTYSMNGDAVQFNFDNIMLPDSNTNEPASHGHVIYSISPKSNIPLGTEITNSASIYFDFNPPILTNTTLNTIWLATSTEGPAPVQDVVLFPNPVHESATLRFEAGSETWTLDILDLQGRVLLTRDAINRGEVQIARGHLPAGTYLYRLQSESGKIARGKMVVQ